MTPGVALCSHPPALATGGHCGSFLHKLFLLSLSPVRHLVLSFNSIRNSSRKSSSDGAGLPCEGKGAYLVADDSWDHLE